MPLCVICQGQLYIRIDLSTFLALFGSELGSGEALAIVLIGGMILLSLILCKIRERYDVMSDQQDQV
ncbi:MAG: hypothetical protein BMS9Abin36_0830 [Gammaproteobacteria bacterium]|nr:MAG: hypothetical protein BMS9Abin36_0830 [Gammaproteobacteria bacterium]